jgi:hypothetical protein
VINCKQSIENVLSPPEEAVEQKRFEDKTQEEINEDMLKKRR